jgi:hypothetical protein
VPREKKITALFAKVRNADRRLSDWMRANHDDLLVELGSGRVVWRPVMQVIAELGLLDEHGKQPTRDTAFRTWQRVRGDAAATRARRQAKPAVLARGEIAPGVRALVGQDDQTSEMGVRPMVRQQCMRLDIRPARPFADMPGSAIQTPDVPAVTAIPTEVAPVEDADAQIQRVFDAIGAARTPMPKIIR